MIPYTPYKQQGFFIAQLPFFDFFQKAGKFQMMQPGTLMI